MQEIPSRHGRALRELMATFDELERPWALTGSTSFALQGVPLEPDDIDVQTDRVGALEMGRLLSEHSHTPISQHTSDSVRSWFGRFELAGVEIEIIGDLERRVGETWVGPIDVSDHLTTVDWEGLEVPVLELSYEAEAYAQLGRSDRARLLSEHAE